MGKMDEELGEVGNRVGGDLSYMGINPSGLEVINCKDIDGGINPLFPKGALFTAIDTDTLSIPVVYKLRDMQFTCEEGSEIHNKIVFAIEEAIKNHLRGKELLVESE